MRGTSTNEELGPMASSSAQPSASQNGKKLKGHGHPVRCMSVVRGPNQPSLLMTWEKTFQLVSLGGSRPGQRNVEAGQKLASWTCTFNATCMASNASGVTWVGYADGSVAVLQPQNGTLEPAKPQVMFNTSPTAISVSDETGEAWIGDSTGRLKVIYHQGGYQVRHDKYAFDQDSEHQELSDKLMKSRGSVSCLLLVGQVAIIGLSCRRSTISVRSVKKAELLDVFDLKASTVEPPTCLSQVPPEHGARDGSTHLISGHAAGRVLLWKLQEGKLTLLAQLCKDIGGIRGIVYFPDLPVLVLGHDGGIISLLAMPHILQPSVISPPGTRPTNWPWHNVVLKVHRYGLVAFCASSDYVITSSYLGTVRAYPHSLLLAEAKKYGFKISRHYDMLSHTSVGDPEGWGVIRGGGGVGTGIPGSAAVAAHGSTEMIPHHSSRPPPLPLDSGLVTETSDPTTSGRVLRPTHASRIHLPADMQALVSQPLPDDGYKDDAWANGRRHSDNGGRPGHPHPRRVAHPAARPDENGNVLGHGQRGRVQHGHGAVSTPIEIPHRSPHHAAHGPPTPEPRVHNVSNFGNLSPSSSSALTSTPVHVVIGNQMETEDQVARLLQQTLSMLSPGQIIQYSELGEMSYLGQGSYGTVHHAKWRGTEVAIKQLMNVKSLDDPNAHSFVNEVRMLQRVCHHPNVMRMCGVCLKPPMLVAQYYKNGPLVKLLTGALTGNEKLIRILTWQKRLSMLHDIATAMVHLHKQGIVHADLRTPNIFLTSDWKIQIGDFGLAREVGELGSVHMSEPTHPRYRPPEVFKQMMWNPAADVWTFGVIMWEMLTWKPAAQMTMAHTAQVVLAAHNDPDSLRPRMPSREEIKGKVGSGLEQYKDLMMSCLNMDPIQRPSFEAISSRLWTLLLWNTVKIQLVSAAHKKVLMSNAVKSMRPTTSEAQSLKSEPSETESDVGLNRKAREIIANGLWPAGGVGLPPGLPPPQRPAALPYRQPDPEPFGPESLIEQDRRDANVEPPGTPVTNSPGRAAASSSGSSGKSPRQMVTSRNLVLGGAEAVGGVRERDGGSAGTSMQPPTGSRSVSPPLSPSKYSPFAQFSPREYTPRPDSPSPLTPRSRAGAVPPASPRALSQDLSNQPSRISPSPFEGRSPTCSPQPSPRTAAHMDTTHAGKDTVTFCTTPRTDQPSSSTPPGSPFASAALSPFHAFMTNLPFSPQPSPRPSPTSSPKAATPRSQPPRPSEPSVPSGNHVTTGKQDTGTGKASTAVAATSVVMTPMTSKADAASAASQASSSGMKALAPLPRGLAESASMKEKSTVQQQTAPLMEAVAGTEQPLSLILGLVTAMQLAAPQTSSEQAMECLKVMISFRSRGAWAGVKTSEAVPRGTGSASTSTSSSSAAASSVSDKVRTAGFVPLGNTSMNWAGSQQLPSRPASNATSLSTAANVQISAATTVEEDETIYPVIALYPTVNHSSEFGSFGTAPAQSSRQSWPFEHLTPSGSNAARLAEICDSAAREFSETLRSSKGRSTSRTTSSLSKDVPGENSSSDMGPPSVFTSSTLLLPAVPKTEPKVSDNDRPIDRSIQRSMSKELQRDDQPVVRPVPAGLTLTVPKPGPAPISVRPADSPPVTPTAVTPTASPPRSPFSNSNNVFAVLVAAQASPRISTARPPTPERSPRQAPSAAPLSDRLTRPSADLAWPPVSPRPPTASQQSSYVSSHTGGWPEGASGVLETPRTPRRSSGAPTVNTSSSTSSYDPSSDMTYPVQRPRTPPMEYNANNLSPRRAAGTPPPSAHPYGGISNTRQQQSPFYSPSTETYTASPGLSNQAYSDLANAPPGHPVVDPYTAVMANPLSARATTPGGSYGLIAPAGYPTDGIVGDASSGPLSARSGPTSADSHTSLRQRVTEMTPSSHPADTSRALFQKHAAGYGDDVNGISGVKLAGGVVGSARVGMNGVGGMSTGVVHGRQAPEHEAWGGAAANVRDNNAVYPPGAAAVGPMPTHSRGHVPGMAAAHVASPPSPARGLDWERHPAAGSWLEQTLTPAAVPHGHRPTYTTPAHPTSAAQSPFKAAVSQPADHHPIQTREYDPAHITTSPDPRSPASPHIDMGPHAQSAQHDPNWISPSAPASTRAARYSAPAALGHHTVDQHSQPAYSTPITPALTTTTSSRSISGSAALHRCGRLNSSSSRLTAEAQTAAMQALTAVDGYTPVQYSPVASRAQEAELRGQMADSRSGSATSRLFDSLRRLGRRGAADHL